MQIHMVEIFILQIFAPIMRERKILHQELCRLGNSMNNVEKWRGDINNMEITENMIEFISGQRTATVTLSNPKHINRIKKLYEDRNQEIV